MIPSAAEEASDEAKRQQGIAAQQQAEAARQTKIAAARRLLAEAELAKFQGPLDSPVNSLIMSPTGAVIAQTEKNVIWRISFGQKPTVLARGTSRASLSLSPSGDLLHLSYEKSWKVIRVNTGSIVIDRPEAGSGEPAFSSNEAMIATPVERTVLIHNLNEAATIVVRFDDEVRALRFSNGDRFLVVVREQRTNVLPLRPDDVVDEVRGRLAKLPPLRPAK